MKLRKFLLSGTTAICALPIMLTAAHAQQYLGTVSNNQNLIVQMNNDATNGEGVYFQEGGVGASYNTFANILNSSASFSGPIYDINDGIVNIGESMDVAGELRVFSDFGLQGVLYDTDSTMVTVNDGLYVRDNTTLDGTVSVAGTAAFTGNATFSANTDIQGVIYNSANAMSVVVDDDLSVTGNAAVTGNLNVSGQSTLDRTNITGTTNITTTGTSTTTIGASTNTAYINSQDIQIGNGASPVGGRTYVSIGTETSADRTILIGNSDGDTRFSMEAGSSSLAAVDGSLVGNVNGLGEGLVGQLNIGDNGDQLVADENGKITTFDGEGRAMTASMIVRSSGGAMHGLVIEEEKLTLSGGTTSASMTLDNRGATFSDPADGTPVQVHGVDDGTAAFDAVNVRQLYSGLAAVLAATPELRLEPGKTGFGIGLGSYGGYHAVGMGFGRMYENGAILTGSVSKAEHSEFAGRASVSWNW